MRAPRCAVFAAAAVLAILPAPARAQGSEPGRVAVRFEVSTVTQQRNEVRIPPDTGPEFSLVDLVGSAPAASLTAARGAIACIRVRCGRALDLAAASRHRPAARWTVFAGYRTIDGGADVDAVFAFAWLNAGVAGLEICF
jgi:hypothetical protein